MPERLFVYGTLRPGWSNHHVVAGIPGRWRRGTVRGRLREGDRGSSTGYPALVLDDDAGPVPGDLLESDGLTDAWDRLDAFEGEGYRRVRATVRLDDGTSVPAWVYVVAS